MKDYIIIAINTSTKSDKIYRFCAGKIMNNEVTKKGETDLTSSKQISKNKMLEFIKFAEDLPFVGYDFESNIQCIYELGGVFFTPKLDLLPIIKKLFPDIDSYEIDEALQFFDLKAISICEKIYELYLYLESYLEFEK